MTYCLIMLMVIRCNGPPDLHIAHHCRRTVPPIRCNRQAPPEHGRHGIGDTTVYRSTRHPQTGKRLFHLLPVDAELKVMTKEAAPLVQPLLLLSPGIR